MPVIVNRDLRRQIEISEEFQRQLREKMGGFTVSKIEGNSLEKAIQDDMKEVGAKMESYSVIEADDSTGSDSDHASKVFKKRQSSSN